MKITTTNQSTQNLITKDTVMKQGAGIAIKAIKTCLATGSSNPKQNPSASQDAFLRKLYIGAVRYAHNAETDGSDGADIAQEAIAFLVPYVGKLLTDTVTDGQIDKEGKPITIIKACFRHVNRYILKHKRIETKRAFVSNPENDLTLCVPFRWDTPDYESLTKTTATIDSLQLTVTQNTVLQYRLQGLSIHEIAEKKSVSRQAIIKTLKQIQVKYTALYGVPKSVIV